MNQGGAPGSGDQEDLGDEGQEVKGTAERARRLGVWRLAGARVLSRLWRRRTEESPGVQGEQSSLLAQGPQHGPSCGRTQQSDRFPPRPGCSPCRRAGAPNASPAPMATAPTWPQGHRDQE